MLDLKICNTIFTKVTKNIQKRYYESLYRLVPSLSRDVVLDVLYIKTFKNLEGLKVDLF